MLGFFPGMHLFEPCIFADFYMTRSASIQKPFLSWPAERAVSIQTTQGGDAWTEALTCVLDPASSCYSLKK